MKDEPFYESRRTYTFPGGDTVVIEHVSELEVRPSGNHRLTTVHPDSGLKNLHIVPTGWIHIEINEAAWTF